MPVLLMPVHKIPPSDKVFKRKKLLFNFPNPSLKKHVRYCHATRWIKIKSWCPKAFEELGIVSFQYCYNIFNIKCCQSSCYCFHPSGPQKTIPQNLAVFLFLGKSGGSSPVTGKLNTAK